LSGVAIALGQQLEDVVGPNAAHGVDVDFGMEAACAIRVILVSSPGCGTVERGTADSSDAGGKKYNREFHIDGRFPTGFNLVSEYDFFKNGLGDCRTGQDGAIKRWRASGEMV
jgi:hypothetical protein